MLLNDLATVARSAGLTVKEEPNWKTHNHGSLSSVESIVIHHTAGSASGDYPSEGTVRNGRSDLPGPLANLGVGRSGKVYVFSSGLAYHAGQVRQSWMDNAHSIGIEVESVGTGARWPDAQVQATAKLVAALCKKYGVPVSRVLGHKEVCSPVGRKVDPVGIPGDMGGFRKLVQQYLSGKEDDMTEAQAKDLDYTKRVSVETQRRVTLMRAELAATRALVNQLVAKSSGLTVAQVEAAVKKAVSESVVDVDVTVQDKTVG